MMPYTDEQLYAALVELAVLDKSSLDAAWVASKSANIRFGTYLLDHDIISDVNLGLIVATIIAVPYIRLSTVNIQDDVLSLIPPEVAKVKRVIPFEKKERQLKVAMENPKDKELQALLARSTGYQIEPYYATSRDIDSAFGNYKRDFQGSFQEMIKKMTESKDPKQREQLVSNLVTMGIEYAYANRASDIHVEPEPDAVVIRFRIDGILHEVLRTSRDLHDQIISRLKVLSNLPIDQHTMALDGRLQVPIEQEELDIRLSIVPTLDGEKAVMRLLTSRSRQFGLTDLGMSESDVARVKNAYTKPYGMVLATGPTGCGKTTTMYAILKLLNSKEKNIATIEDPVEYQISGINQIQVNPKTNLTFAQGLKSILRQDPDIILVGEIRDAETAGIAINSAMTGHLVLSTLHTNDAATALPRFIDMGIEPFLISSTINIIIAQRLIRKICEKCRYSIQMTHDELMALVGAERTKQFFDDKPSVSLYKGKGCPVCHGTGYTGRIGIFEVLELSPAVKELVIAKADSAKITEVLRSGGGTTMFDDGMAKVVAGITTIEEILRVTKE